MTITGDADDGRRDTPRCLRPVSDVAGRPSPPPTEEATDARADRIVTGQAAETKWGPVQVEITVRAGHLIRARAVRSPDSNPVSVQINRSALPILNKETVSAGTAEIDAVTGATVTSEGYKASLQSAIDHARL